jgi:hypothetical protein
MKEYQVDTETIFSQLKNNVCEVIFTKVDGTKRRMVCTLCEMYLPKQMELEESIQNNSTPKTSISVWDVEKNGWRSFKIENVSSFKALIRS